MLKENSPRRDRDTFRPCPHRWGRNRCSIRHLRRQWPSGASGFQTRLSTSYSRHSCPQSNSDRQRCWRHCCCCCFRLCCCCIPRRSKKTPDAGIWRKQNYSRNDSSSPPQNKKDNQRQNGVDCILWTVGRWWMRCAVRYGWRMLDGFLDAASRSDDWVAGANRW